MISLKKGLLKNPILVHYTKIVKTEKKPFYY